MNDIMSWGGSFALRGEQVYARNKFGEKKES